MVTGKLYLPILESGDSYQSWWLDRGLRPERLGLEGHDHDVGLNMCSVVYYYCFFYYIISYYVIILYYMVCYYIKFI